MKTLLRRPRASLLALAIVLATGTPMSFAAPAAPAAVDIPFEQFTLPNGLRVIVHTDRKAPIVAVNIWYHVGSKDEPAGRSRFRAPVRAPDVPGLGEPRRRILHARSNWSAPPTRTAPPTPTAPTTSRTCRPPRSTWRCGWSPTAWATCSARSTRRARRAARRGAERKAPGREPALRPGLGRASPRRPIPKGHPYHHTTIGSMNDLNAASLDDVKTWFRSWYGPNNAVLVLAGDIDLATAKEKVAQLLRRHPGRRRRWPRSRR